MGRMVGLLGALALLGGRIGEAHGRENAESCRRFVTEYYAWYVKATENSGYEQALKRRPSSFSAELIRRLKQDIAAQAKTPGEISGLDFDPFLNTQDVAQKYVAGKVTRIGKRFRAEVSALWNGKKDPKPAVIPELVFERGRWVFVNFHYNGTANLLKILADLRKERRK